MKKVLRHVRRRYWTWYMARLMPKDMRDPFRKHILKASDPDGVLLNMRVIHRISKLSNPGSAAINLGCSLLTGTIASEAAEYRGVIVNATSQLVEAFTSVGDEPGQRVMELTTLAMSIAISAALISADANSNGVELGAEPYDPERNTPTGYVYWLAEQMPEGEHWTQTRDLWLEHRAVVRQGGPISKEQIDELEELFKHEKGA